jgi:hypothetical protein
MANLGGHVAVREMLLGPEQQSVEGHAKIHGLGGRLRCLTDLCDAPDLLVELLGSQLSL